MRIKEHAPPQPMPEAEFKETMADVSAEANQMSFAAKKQRTTTRAELAQHLLYASDKIQAICEGWAKDRAAFASALEAANLALNIAKENQDAGEARDAARIEALSAQLAILQSTLLKAVQEPNLALGRVMGRVDGGQVTSPGRNQENRGC